MKRSNFVLLLIVVIPLLIFLSCSGDRKLKKKVDKADVNIKIIRFEEELFKVDIYNIEEEVSRLRSKYQNYFDLYSNKVITVGDPSQTGYHDRLKSFITDHDIYEVYNIAKFKYADLEHLTSRLQLAFKYFKYYFPENQVPDIYTHISGFNQSIFTSEKILSISLDKYLGTDEPIYNRLYPPLPKYQRFVMHADKIPSDVIRAWIITESEYEPEKDNLMSRMIYEGRSYYIADRLLAEEPDTLCWGFTSDQLRFCEINEQKMWMYLVENKLLFETDHFTIDKYTGEAPFTKAFGNESPGKAVLWIGYQIVKSYAEKNNIELKELLYEINYQKIMNLSRYNP